MVDVRDGVVEKQADYPIFASMYAAFVSESR